MTIEFLMFNSLLTLLGWAVPLLILSVLIKKWVPLKVSLILTAVFVVTMSYLSSSNRPKIRITEEAPARVTQPDATITNNAPETLTFDERLEKNQRLYEANR